MAITIIAAEALAILVLARLWRLALSDRDGWRWSAREWLRLHHAERGWPPP